jgi:hypothetical protein
MPPASAFPYPVYQSDTGPDWVPLFCCWTGSGIGIFVHSSTGLTRCRTVRHSGICETFYKGEKEYIHPARPHCELWTRVHSARTHGFQSGLGIFPAFSCLSPASASGIRVRPVLLVTDKSGNAQLRKQEARCTRLQRNNHELVFTVPYQQE